MAPVRVLLNWEIPRPTGDEDPDLWLSRALLRAFRAVGLQPGDQVLVTRWEPTGSPSWFGLSCEDDEGEG